MQPPGVNTPPPSDEASVLCRVPSLPVFQVCRCSKSAAPEDQSYPTLYDNCWSLSPIVGLERVYAVMFVYSSKSELIEAGEYGGIFWAKHAKST
jgi:hypothetical protein